MSKLVSRIDCSGFGVIEVRQVTDAPPEESHTFFLQSVTPMSHQAVKFLGFSTSHAAAMERLDWLLHHWSHQAGLY